MSKVLFLAAVGLVLATNVITLVQGLRNRRDAPGGTVDLTERELHLPPASGDSTVLLLDLQWEALSNDPKERRVPDWLDAAKLQELGFDCREPVTSPHASAHYSAMLPLLRFVVLDYASATNSRVERDGRPRSKLVAVDAGTDPARLRQKYADPARFIITHGLLRPFVSDRSRPEGDSPPTSRLRGRIIELVPNTIFVPQPHSQLLLGLRERGRRSREETAVPRFAVSVSWGTAYEPWVRGVRLLGAAEPGANER